MASNHKLTDVLKGRTITGTQNHENVLKITFDDGSVMTVRTAGQIHSAATGGKVKGVRQKDTELDLDFENGPSMQILTEEATSCVMVRDKSNALEYAD